MNPDSLYQYTNEDSIRGDLSRELLGIYSDYNAGTITVEDKELLVNEVLSSFHATELAEDVATWQWAVAAATLIVSFV